MTLIPADLVIFTVEIPNGKHFLLSVGALSKLFC